MELADTILNETYEPTKEEKFDAMIARQKCPFRIDHRTYGDSYKEEMMPCDPKCLACIRNDNYEFSCLRMIQIKYNAPQIEVFSWKED